MASTLVGRTTCPECGFASAHVKRSEKCTYRFCPECGAQYFPKNEAQTKRLTAGMRAEGAPAPEPAPAPDAKPAPQPTPQPAPAPAKRRGLFV